jgi:hypothetical protein
VERHRQQSLLGAVGADAAANVQEQSPLALVQREDPALLLDDVEPRRLGGRRSDVDGRVEPAGDADDAQLLPLGTRPGDGWKSDQQQKKR